MIERLFSLLPSGRRRDVAMTAAGVGSLLVGRKVIGLSLMAKGLAGLEDRWQLEHPEHDGTLEHRWELAKESYDQTHQHPTNRVLHAVGLPMVAGGALGLLTLRSFRPLWMGAAGCFTVGCAIQLIGHAALEERGPGFTEDPLSAVVGPFEDIMAWTAGDDPEDSDFIIIDDAEVRANMVVVSEPALA